MRNLLEELAPDRGWQPEQRTSDPRHDGTTPEDRPRDT